MITSILPVRSQLDVDRYAKDSRVIECAEAAHNLAVVLGNAQRWLWSLPMERLLALLNEDVDLTEATLSQNIRLGAAVNAALDAADVRDEHGALRYPCRAPVAGTRADVRFDGIRWAELPPPEAMPSRMEDESVREEPPQG